MILWNALSRSLLAHFIFVYNSVHLIIVTGLQICTNVCFLSGVEDSC